MWGKRQGGVEGMGRESKGRNQGEGGRESVRGEEEGEQARVER